MREEESIFTCIKTLEYIVFHVGAINKKLVYIVASGMVFGIFETIVHDMPKEYVLQIERFYTAGWEILLGVRFGSK